MSVFLEKKVAIFSSRRISLKGGLEKFGWPNKFKKKGFFIAVMNLKNRKQKNNEKRS